MKVNAERREGSSCFLPYAEGAKVTLYTVRGAAEQLGVSSALIYALIAARKIRHERHGLKRGRIRIPQDALDEYRQSRTVDVEDAGNRITPPPKIRLKHLKV
jgi:excisionase family DNA binding protein